jgi:hypothetical protein
MREDARHRATEFLKDRYADGDKAESDRAWTRPSPGSRSSGWT